MTGRKVIWVMLLPSIDPPFDEEDPGQDNCMRPDLTWRQRLARQAAPRRTVRDCCFYHRQDFHAIAAAVLAIHRQLARNGLKGEEADELRWRLLEESGLPENEQQTAMLLMDEDCGIQLWRPVGHRWTYQEGRHRARALMDAGVCRILVTVTDDRDAEG